MRYADVVVKPCPYCSTQVQEDVRQCPFCQRWLDPTLDSTLNADSPPIVLPPRTTSGLAIGSLVCAIFALGPGSIAAVILGYLALRQIRRDPLRRKGKRMALAGVILGWLGILGTTAALLFAIYFWKSLDGAPKKPHVRQVHLLSAAVTSVPYRFNPPLLPPTVLLEFPAQRAPA